MLYCYVNNVQVQRAVGLAVQSVSLDATLQYTTVQSAVPQCADLAAAAGYSTAVLSFLQSQQTGEGIPGMDCVSSGHLLFFVDAHLGTVSRIALLPISTTEVYHPTTMQQQQQDGSVYTSSYHRQEHSELVAPTFMQPVVLITGVDGVTSITIDVTSSYAFVSAQYGVVIRVNYVNLLSTPTPVGVNMQALLRHGAAGKTHLPAWIQLLSLSDSRARVQDVCVLPAVTSAVNSDGARNVSASWQQQ